MPEERSTLAWQISTVNPPTSSFPPRYAFAALQTSHVELDGIIDGPRWTYDIVSDGAEGCCFFGGDPQETMKINGYSQAPCLSGHGPGWMRDFYCRKCYLKLHDLFMLSTIQNNMSSVPTSARPD